MFTFLKYLFQIGQEEKDVEAMIDAANAGDEWALRWLYKNGHCQVENLPPAVKQKWGLS